MRHDSGIGQRLAVLIVQGEERSGALEKTQRSLAAHSVLPETTITVEERGAAFVASLKRVARALPDRDVVCLQAGVELPFAWDARLAKGAYAAPRIAAAVPMCDASALHALVDVERRGAAATQAALIDRSAYCMGTRGYYETPALHPVCAYLRRDALAATLAPLDDSIADPATALAHLGRRWRALGWSSVVCDYIYVGFDGPVAAIPDVVDAVEVSAFMQHSPLGALRRGVNDALVAGLPPVSTPALDVRPVQLHIMHFWGGGLDKWVREFGRADAQRTNLILATYRIGDTGGQRVVLYSDPDAKVPVRTWDIARPLRSTAASCIEYRQILEQIVREFQVESIIVSSLIGHSLEALQQPVKTLVVCHDFYPLCQAINPRFDEVCAGCTVDDLRSCAATNPHYRTLGSPGPEEWQALRTAYVDLLLDRGIEMVVPSQSVAATLERLDPRMEKVSLRVIPHGIDFEVEKLPAPKIEPSRPLRLVVLGRLPANKGAELLRSAAAELKPMAEITLVGCGPHAMALARECGWSAIEVYTLEELPRLLREIDPHAAVLASLVPETFSYTLSELWALGIPPLATSLGSFKDRIRDGVDGFLFAPDKDSLVALVRSLRSQPERLERVAREIATLGKSRTTREMVEDYHALVPLQPRAVARFEVGIGSQTALTEPYRHLTEAYAQLTAAYARMSEAYVGSNAAYEHARAEFDRVHAELAKLRALWDQYGRDFDSLKVGLHWWRAPEALRLLSDLRGKIYPAQEAIPAGREKSKP